MDRRSAEGLLFLFRSIMTDRDDSWREGTGRHTCVQVVGWKGALFIIREVYWLFVGLSSANRSKTFGAFPGRLKRIRLSPCHEAL